MEATPTPAAEPKMQPMRVATTLLLCFLIAALEGYDLQIIGVAAPALRATLGLSPEQTGFAFSSSLIGLAIGAVIGGTLADKVGRKPVLLFSVLTFGGFTAATAFADSYETLLAARLLTGIGLGGAMPNLIALVSETVPRRHITTAVAVMFWGIPIGGMGVALLARMEGMGTRELFLIGGALPIIVMPLLWLGLKETLGAAKRHGGGGALSALFSARSAATTLLLWIVFAITLLLLALLLNWLPSLIIEKGHASEQAFLAPFAFNVGSILGAAIIGWACDRIGVRSTMIFVYAGMAAAIVGMANLTEIDHLLAISAVLGFFVLGAQFALYGVAPRLYDDAVRGAGVGAAVAAGRIGAIVGPIVAGSLIGAGMSGDDVMYLIAPLTAVAGLGMIILTVTARERLRAGGGHGPAAH